MATHQKPTYTDIESWLEHNGLLDGSMPADTMVVCACWCALDSNEEAQKKVIDEGDFDAFCQTVSNIWTDCETHCDLAKIADLTADYIVSEGEYPERSFADLASWAYGEGLL